MGYDLNLAQRIRDHLSSISALEEKKMFGGVAFLILGNMACGVHGDDMIVRVGAENMKPLYTGPSLAPLT